MSYKYSEIKDGRKLSEMTEQEQAYIHKEWERLCARETINTPEYVFIQKADASTIGDLADGVMKVFGETEKKIIGSRHGEKLYETLMTREERLRAEDMGKYFRVFADNRDLNYDKYFKAMLEEKGFCYEMVTEFSYSLIMSVDNPLAKKEIITFDDLTDYIEIAHADPYVPSMPLSKVVKEELPDNIDRRIFIFERASQFDLLSNNPETFMWVSPAPESLLKRYNLVQKKCVDNKKIYKDVLIYKNGYKLSKLDRQFMTELCEAKRKYL